MESHFCAQNAQRWGTPPRFSFMRPTHENGICCNPTIYDFRLCALAGETPATTRAQSPQIRHLAVESSVEKKLRRGLKRVLIGNYVPQGAKAALVWNRPILVCACFGCCFVFSFRNNINKFFYSICLYLISISN